MYWMSVTNCVQNHNVFQDRVQLLDIALAVDLFFFGFAYYASKATKVLLLALLVKVLVEVENQKLHPFIA